MKTKDKFPDFFYLPEPNSDDMVDLLSDRIIQQRKKIAFLRRRIIELKQAINLDKIKSEKNF